MSKKWLISMMATAMVFTLGLSAACATNTPSTSSSSEEPTSSSSTVTGTIKLNASTAKIDVYDTLQLTATLENVEGDVIWSSSKEEVATVDANGLVTAHSAGTVTITATVGDVSASCEVTTVVSEVPPIMTVSANALQLKKGDSYNVTVSTTWKDKEMENAQYSWYLEDPDKEESDIVSILVSEDGRTATFTGLAHGTETYCVSTFVNGMALVETIVINSVDNDITFDVSNLEKSPEGYKTSISLAEAEGHVTSIKPDITVFYQGEAQDIEILWTADSDEYAAMSEDGTITGLKPGTTIFQALVTINGKIGILNVTVDVYAPAFEYAVEESVELDLNGDVNANLSLDDIVPMGTLVEATIGDKAFATISYADGVVSVDKASIGNVYGDATITAIFHVMKGNVVASIEKVTIPVKTYRSISTMAELNNLANYVQMNGTSAYGDFRVTADIDFGGADLKPIGKWDGTAWTHVWKGTFDGQGHVIKNAVMPGGNGGLFNTIASGGIVRNIVFINAEIKNESGMIATGNDGTGLVENVFVHGKLTTTSGGQNWAPASLIVSKNSGIIRGCFAVLAETTTTNYGGMIAGFNKLNGVTENCVAINMSGKKIHLAGQEGVLLPSQSENCGITSKAYTSIADYYAEAEESEFHAWADAILQEYLKPLEEAGVQINAPKAEVAKNSSTQLSVVNPGYLISWSLKNEVAGVSIDENGLVSATNEAEEGATITVVATGAFGTTCEFTMTVVKETVITTIAGTEYDASRNAGAPVDVSSISNKALTLRHVAVAGVMIEGATMENGVVSVPNQYLADGETANDVTISVTDGDKIYEISVPVVKITMVIMDKADLDWFAANSAKSQNTYYVLGADIEYTGVYTASGLWINNVLDGRGHTINNFVTNTGLLLGGGEPSNTPAARDATVVKNINFTNAKTTVAGKAIIMDAGGFTLKNLYVSVAADALEKTYALWRDHYGNSFVYSTVVEYLGATGSSVCAGIHDGRGIIKGLYAINAAAFDQGGGSDKDWEPDYRALFASWADFEADAAVNKFFTEDYWTIVEGVPVPKTLSIAINNTNTNVPAGTDYKVNFPGYASISINEVEGVTLNGNVISVAETVAGGTKIVVTLTNAITGEESTKEITVLSNTVIDAAEVDFELTNATVSTAKLTEDTLENVSITRNGATLVGATFENGVLTLSNEAFGKGMNDWGNQTVVVSGTTASGMVTINVPVLAYKNVSDLKNLESVGFVVKNGKDNFRSNVYGYFKLTSDFDAKGWAGNGTYDGTYKGSNYVLFGTVDGQGHVISNYTATTNRGIFFENQGTIKNLVLKNAVATGNSGIVVTSNTSGGRVENVYVEGKLNATGADWCSAALIVAKNDANSVIENCVTVFMGASTYDVVYQGLIAGYNAGTMKNNVAINLTANTYYMAPRKAAAATTEAGEYAGETNTLYTSWAEVDALSDSWAVEYLQATEQASLAITAEKLDVSVGGSLQLSAKNSAFVKAWSLKEAIAGVSVSADGIVSVAEDVAQGTSITVVVTGYAGATAEITLTVVKDYEEVAVTLDEVKGDLRNGKSVSVDLTSYNIAETVNLPEGATFADGILTIPAGTTTSNWGKFNATMIARTEDKEYTFTIPVFAYVSLASQDDFKNMYEYAVKEDLGNGVTNHYAYYLLTANVTLNSQFLSADEGAWVSVAQSWSKPFCGIFDGQYKELTWHSGWAQERGIFKQISAGGVFKNVKLIDCKPFMNSTVANRNYGLIENVYGEIFIQGAQDANKASMGIASKNWGTIRNCMVIIKGVATTNMAYPNMITWNQNVNAKVENCVAINLSGFRMVAVQQGSSLAAAADAVEAIDTTKNAVFQSWADYAVSETAYDDWAIEYVKAFEAKNLALTVENTDVAIGYSLPISVKNSSFVKAWSLKEAVAGVSVSEDGIVSVTEEATPDTTFTVVATGYMGATAEITLNVAAVAKEEAMVTINKTEYDASKNDGITLNVIDGEEEIIEIRNVIVGGKLVEGATFNGKTVFIPNAALVDGETANAVAFIAETETTIYTVNASIVKISKVIMNVDDLNWFAANSNKSQNKYYVLGADIEYSGIYEMAAGNWMLNVLDGRGHVINNFVTSTSLIGAASSSQAANALAGTVVKNIVFTNAKSTVAGKAIIVDSSTFTLKNIYVSVAADTAANTYGIWRDHFGAASVQGCVVEYLGATAAKISGLAHNGRGIFMGVYGINVTAFDANNGSDWKEGVNGGFKADVYSLFASWSDFAENEAATAYFTNDFWTISENGIPMPKTLGFGFVANANDKVAAGTTYRVDHNGYATVAINEVEGVSISNGIISIADNVAAGTKITVTLTSVVTGDTATKELTVLGNTIIDADTLDFDLNNATVSSAKLTDETLTNVTITLNGVSFTEGTFEDGVLTLSNASFGKGQNDWGMQNFVIAGNGENGMVTINLPVLAYKSITDLKSLEKIGYSTVVNTNQTKVYGYFKLTDDFDATGWDGNGTYSSRSTYIFYGTLDGQFHTISNYTTISNNRGIFFDNYGTIKNLIVTNMNIKHCSGGLVTSNSGLIENCIVEGSINSNGANWCGSGLIAAKNNGATGIIRNCVSVLTTAKDVTRTETIDVDGDKVTETVSFDGADNYYQATIAGFSHTNAKLENCVSINLSGKTVYMAPGVDNKVMDPRDNEATEKANATNVTYTSWADFDAAQGSHWTVEYLAAIRG